MEIGSSQITFGGLATGLDSRAIIDALLGVERIPILRLQDQKARLGQQSDLFSTLDDRLDGLRSAVESLDTVGELASFAATSSDESALGVAAGGTASEGSHSIEILELAAAESRATDGFADKDSTNVGSGTFTITVGSQDYTVDLSQNPTNTLEDVRDAINASGAPVTATVIDNGTGSDPFQLVVTSDETGADNAYSVDLSNFNHNPGFNIDDPASQLQEGTDSHIRVDGLDVFRSSNTVSDVIEGVTLELNATTGGQPVEVTVDADLEGVKERLQSFIDAYNDVVSIIDAQNQVDEEGQTDAVLFGDSGVRTIGARLRSAVNHEASSVSGAFTSLAALGIHSDSSGRLSLDDADFEEALESDFQGVMELFTNSTDGLAQEFKTAVDELTDPADGIIRIRQDGIASREKTLDDRITRLEDRLDRVEQRLVDRFARLETLVSTFQAQGAALNGFPSG